MRVVIAPDKFRGSLTASEAAAAIARGILRVEPPAELVLAPLADGGEGIVEALISATNGTWCEAVVTGPLGTPTVAQFGLLGNRTTAVVAMSAASGHHLIDSGRRDPTRTSTRGTGDLILAALELGITHLIVGIGGSATNDGGSGMAQALGWRLLDAHGLEIGPGGGSLADLDRIDGSTVFPQLRSLVIEVACDVSNPLCGPTGASVIYGPQKGATPAQVEQLDANLAHLARIIQRDLNLDIRDIPGAGAAGGLGAGLIAFTSATLRPGIDLVLEAVRLRDHLERADLCITGEGCLDASTASGKTVAGVARLARSLGVPTIALSGTIGPGADRVSACGVSAYFSISPGPASLDDALSHADAWLADTTEQVMRLFLAGSTERLVNPSLDSLG